MHVLNRQSEIPDEIHGLHRTQDIYAEKRREERDENINIQPCHDEKNDDENQEKESST